jgi:hypothetical protein
VRGVSERTADSAAGWAYAHRIQTGRAGTWTQENRRWLTIAALLVVALWNHPTVLTVVLLVLVLLAVLALVALLAASGRATADARTRGPRPPGDAR